jgi:hypothetical protein
MEKRYTALEVANILKTNPETVRRWIRQGKLEVLKGKSRTSANIVTESMLTNFLRNSPKYASIAAPFLASTSNISSIVGASLGFALGSSLLKIVAEHYYRIKELENSEVSVAAMINLLKTEIDTRKGLIEEKWQTIHQLKQEIYKEELVIKNSERLIEELSTKKEE